MTLGAQGIGFVRFFCGYIMAFYTEDFLRTFSFLPVLCRGAMHCAPTGGVYNFMGLK
jgi:hypothetical protein